MNSGNKVLLPIAEDVQLALVFGTLGAVAVLMLFPYLLETMPQIFAKLPVLLPVLALAQAAQAFVLLSLLSLAGLRMGHWVGLGSPWLHALRFGRPRRSHAWLRAVVLGLVGGLAIVAISPLFWIAIVAAALLFGAGHLPAVAKIWTLDSAVILRTFALNAVAGFVFGWLYWRQGLESAMLGHSSADLVLHVAAPLLAGALA